MNGPISRAQTAVGNSTGTTMTENCYKRLCDENKLQKNEKKRTSGSENLIGCDVAETAPPKKLLLLQNGDVKT